jgi:ubiquinone/menaquinone biosynthesis C-methylase UbiE
MAAAPRVPPVPAVLRLVQSVVLGRWRASVETLYRELAALTAAEPGRDVLVCGCGDARDVEWLGARTGATVVGVDPDAQRVQQIAARLRATSDAPVSVQQSVLDDLPFEDAVFDAAIGQPMLAACADPARAVAELVRVVKPYAPVVLCQLTWNHEFDAEGKEAVIARLGLGMRHLVEWKQIMREAGLVEIEVQDWTDRGTRGRVASDARFTLREKLQIAGRAWRRWGWRAARSAVEQEIALLDELARERAVGFHVIHGVKWPHPRTP